MTSTTIDNEATRLFAAQFGGEPDGVWSSPGRVNLIGEHTDYNDGFALPFAIDHRAVVAVRLRSDDRVAIVSTFDGEPVEADLASLDGSQISSWAAYVFGIVWALGEDHGRDRLTGFELALHSDVPVGAGLSSSASIECATALALDELWSLGASRASLVLAGQRAENTVVGAPTGIMDQTASLFGETDSAVFLDCRTQDAVPVPLGFAEAGLQVLVVDTRVSHDHATGGYASRREACERAAAALGVPALRDATLDDLQSALADGRLDDETFRRARHVVTEDDRVLATVRTLRESGARAIGELLDASHRSMRDDFEISVPEIDAAVDAMRGAGAVGARLTGGGFGGSAIGLLPVERVADATDAVRRAFADAGYTEPRIFTVSPSAGARRDG
ncbi:galactokinase [Labedella gwakjiensis]|uniref:Galactokinase n=1 Tax=Labedella gwakjiensis TaxID=390269 RepID=A0A2P8GSP3_9MICO|nr:galactokinase [Labedella gwakjiensis]PSL36989.1 galactokinase [Labedella gwakjiensis]RUQ81851.1 galactokinase [Labedella gwakjiensis]